MASQTICIALLALFALTISSCHGASCNPKCPRIFQPVCAVNNFGQTKTFNNMCMMEYDACINRDEGWRFVKEGGCGSSVLSRTAVDECPKFCPLAFEPICGINNSGQRRTFDNNCVFEATQCTERTAGWKIIGDHDCSLVPNTANECPSFCTFEYAPVCGQDQTGNMKTFGNLCAFKMEQCNNRAAAWRIVAEAACKQLFSAEEKPKCSNVCTDDLAPVCGVSNTGVFKTFENKCMLEMEGCNNRDAGWKLFAQQPCDLKKPLDSKSCDKPCTREYVPVCAQDNTGNLKSFPNKCVFEIAQCNDRDAGWKIISAGDCSTERYVRGLMKLSRVLMARSHR